MAAPIRRHRSVGCGFALLTWVGPCVNIWVIAIETSRKTAYNPAGLGLGFESSATTGLKGRLTMTDITDTKVREDDLRGARGPGIAPEPHETPTACDCSDSGLVEGISASSEEGTSVMGPLDRILTTIEKREILAALKRANGQRTLAARLLGISRSRLYRRMEALDIDPRELSGAPEVHPHEDA